MKPQLTTVRKFTDSLAFMNLPVFDYIERDDFAIVRMEELGMKLPYQTAVFRPDYFSLIVVLEGTATYLVGDKTFELGKNHVLFTQPHTFFSSKWKTLGTAYNISFSKQFLMQFWPDGIDEIQKFDHEKGYVVNLADDIMKYFESICLDIYNEAVSCAPYKYEIITNLVYNLLLLIRQEQYICDTENPNQRYNPYVTAFMRDLEDNFTSIASGETDTLLNISDYASKQNLNESYLSKTVSTTTGKSVNQWIDENRIIEIKYQLKYTDKPMRDIATLYGFDDVNYFYNYFKRHTQNAPGAFRKDFNASRILAASPFHAKTSNS